MHKLYIPMAFLTSLILGSGFTIVGQSVLAQNFGYNDYSYDSYSDYSSSYNKDPRNDKAMIQTHMTAIPTTTQI